MTKDQAFAKAFLNIAAELPWPSEQHRLIAVFWDYGIAADAYARLCVTAGLDD